MTATRENDVVLMRNHVPYSDPRLYPNMCIYISEILVTVIVAESGWVG